MLNANLKLLRRSAVLSAASLLNLVAIRRPTTCHLNPPVQGCSERVCHVSWRDLTDKLTDEKCQKALHEAVVHSVMTGKGPGQHTTKHPAPGSCGPKKGQGQLRKKKRPAKKGGQPFKQGHLASKGGRKSDVNS